MKTFSYLDNTNWENITREERFFTAELYYYFKYKKQPIDFINFFLKSCSTISCVTEEDLKNEWDIGFEVCFYRDMINYLNYKYNKKLLYKEFHQKRTFDLCLFSEEKILIIEAKVQEKFESKQLETISGDKELIPTLLKNLKNTSLPIIQTIFLATNEYFNEIKKIKENYEIKKIKENYFTWKNLYEYSKNKYFEMADELYPKKHRN